MNADHWAIYALMLKSRFFEIAVKDLWDEGLISGEMHMGMGEEAIVAGIVTQLTENDAMALDHRGTPPMLMRGVDPVLLLKEFMGKPDGLCKGMGGHMHLFSKDCLAASSGIVGASGPAAVGFALAGQTLRPGSVAVAFFGDGALNSGALMESMNLAASWKLPVVFICKDNEWAITTKSESVTGGGIRERAVGFGLEYFHVDGRDVESTAQGSADAINHARNGNEPAFLHATCAHLEGHFLGDALLNMTRKPIEALTKRVAPMVASLTKTRGASIKQRADALGAVMSMVLDASTSVNKDNDPLARARPLLVKDDAERLKALEDRMWNEVQQAVTQAVQ